MGICLAKNDGKTREIDAAMRQESNHDQDVIKLLFLGAGGSGKSTLFKQLRLLHGFGLQEPERRKYTNNIHQNVVYGMQTLVTGGNSGYGGNYTCQQDIAEYILALDGSHKVTKTTAEMFKKAWSDEGIKENWKNRSKYQVQDSLRYFIANIDRIASEDYIPSKDDCLHVRVRTTGIVEEKLTINNRSFKIVDVGGQRSERRKWINCFDGVTGLIFVESLISYDQMLYEDETTNRMKESLFLFKTLCSENMPAFKDSCIVLFLNKSDLFSELVRCRPITSCFPEYNGLLTESAQYDYIRKMYEMQNTTENRKIFVHKTCATNTDQMKIIFNAVNHVIINRALIRAGLIVG